MNVLTIYSVENAGIRYVSAALQRECFDTSILRDWVHSTDDANGYEIEINESYRAKQPKVIGLGFLFLYQ